LSPAASLPTLEAAPTPCALQALGWWALQFSPRVCELEQVVLLEVQASVRLFAGSRALLNRIRGECAEQGVTALSVAPTALAALALLHAIGPNAGPELRTATCGARSLAPTLDALPLDTLAAVAVHAPTLERLGCQRLGQVRRLPRGGLSRRFGAGLLEALDRAYGLKPETYPWIELPEQFSVRLEFLGRIEVAEGMMFGANRLLLQLKNWLQARQCGVTALVLHWEHDLHRRGEASQGSIEIRTAEATRDTQHLARLLGEHLARTVLAAPVVAIRLEASGVEPLATLSSSLLVEDQVTGESLQQLIERLSARLGPERVLRAEALADHRPQRMQSWTPASPASGGKPARSRKPAQLPGMVASHPPWILRKPIRLAVVRDRPLYQGPLVLLAGPERLEAGWWGQAEGAGDGDEDLNLRDYFIAESTLAGLLWIYRQRAAGDLAWYLHGVYG